MSDENIENINDELRKDLPDDVGEDLYHHNYTEEKYVVPSNELIRERLEWFRDQKLGFMVHFGPYSQIGIMESWGVCDEDWTYSANDWQENRSDFKKDYFDLGKSFNPVRFNPDEWAQLMADCGFKYLIFTTKHHDGYCMWDTKYTDYKISSKDCAFHENRNADVCKVLFDAVRKKNIAVAAYFSKADWSCPYYWEDRLADGEAYGRNPSYDVKSNPEKWGKFCDYTKNQILELMRDYGRIDILWLDAGWVCAENGQDIKLGEIVEEARKLQPWLISADRTIGGEYENYVTPEQTIPPYPINVPWESNITEGISFAYKFDDEYKDVYQIVNILVDVVCKGGNLALNTAPQPDGKFPAKAVKTLRDLGAWMKINGDAIYGTRVAAPYRKGKFGFTQKNGTVYAIELFGSAQDKVESQVEIPYSGEVKTVRLLETGETVNFTITSRGIAVSLNCVDVEQKAPAARVFVLEK